MNASVADISSALPPACASTCNNFLNPLKSCLDEIKLDNSKREIFGTVQNDVVVPASSTDTPTSILQVHDIWVYSDLASDCYCQRDLQDSVHECNDCLKTHIATAFDYKSFIRSCNALAKNKELSGTGYGVDYSVISAASSNNAAPVNYDTTDGIPPPMAVMRTVASLIPPPTTAKYANVSSKTLNVASVPSYAADFFDPRYHGQSSATSIHSNLFLQSTVLLLLIIASLLR